MEKLEFSVEDFIDESVTSILASESQESETSKKFL